MQYTVWLDTARSQRDVTRAWTTGRRFFDGNTGERLTADEIQRAGKAGGYDRFTVRVLARGRGCVGVVEVTP